MNNIINRRVLIKSLLLLFSSSFSFADSNNYKKFTIIFGSCSNQNNKMEIPSLPIFHPAYLLRRPTNKSLAMKDMIVLHKTSYCKN